MSRGFVKIIKCICQVVKSISADHLPNQIKLKFDQKFKSRWNFCFCSSTEWTRFMENTNFGNQFPVRKFMNSLKRFSNDTPTFEQRLSIQVKHSNWGMALNAWVCCAVLSGTISWYLVLLFEARLEVRCQVVINRCRTRI